MWECMNYWGATGCEVIWDQDNKGCYVHTEEVAFGNGVDNHLCLVFAEENWDGHGSPDQDFYFDCESELVCDWFDCHPWEEWEHEEGVQECWKEECWDDCGDYLCVLWHWDDDNWMWIEDECTHEDPAFEDEWDMAFDEEDWSDWENDLEEVDWEEEAEYAQLEMQSVAEDAADQMMAAQYMFNDTIAAAWEALDSDPAQAENDAMMAQGEAEQMFANWTMAFFAAADESGAGDVLATFVDDVEEQTGSDDVSEAFEDVDSTAEAAGVVAEVVGEAANEPGWFSDWFGWLGEFVEAPQEDEEAWSMP